MVYVTIFVKQRTHPAPITVSYNLTHIQTYTHSLKHQPWNWKALQKNNGAVAALKHVSVHCYVWEVFLNLWMCVTECVYVHAFVWENVQFCSFTAVMQ